MAEKLSPALADQLKNMVGNAKSIVVTAHKSPDGDAAGSVLAVHLLLKALGKNVTTILPDDVPDFLQWLPAFDEIVIFEHKPEEAKKKIAGADLLFSLDYNNLGRVGKEMEAELANAKGDFILIDHHHQPGEFARLVFSNTDSCSTCQLIYEMIEQCGWMQYMDTDIAACIYCGIMTDSGSFRFSSVTEETHRIAGHLISIGLDHARVHREVYDTNLMDRLRLIGYALSEKLEVIPDCATALISLNKEELDRFSYRQGDTEGLVNQALSIKGVNLAAFFREGNNEIKISFRSKGNFDVNTFARRNWSGGGHSDAAGGRAEGTLEAAIERFKKEVQSIKHEIIAS